MNKKLKLLDFILWKKSFYLKNSLIKSMFPNNIGRKSDVVLIYP